jgi:hypothetical protein
MATVVGATVLTLIDFAKRTDPDGSAAVIAEVLSQTNEIQADMQYIEGNLPTGHQTSIRTGLPAVAWRLLNGTITPSKSTVSQITEAFGILEAWSEVDPDLADLGGNRGAYRLGEAKAFMEAMSQENASVLFYGNAGLNPEKFTGFNVRYSSLSGGNSQNIIDGGGTGTDNSSVWLIGWGENTVIGGFPKGSTAGLQHNDYGEQTVGSITAIGTARMRALQERYQWKCGLILKDWRYAVRLCNIDISNLVAESSNVDLQNKMIRMIHRIPNINACRPAFYMNRTVFEMLDIQRREDVRTGGGLNYANIDGVMTPLFRNIPLRTTDALTIAETRVT